MDAMDELQQEVQKKIEQAKSMGPQFCASCTRPIDFEGNAEVFQTRDVPPRYFCNQWCATRPKAAR